jgi:hypothetical protein
MRMSQRPFGRAIASSIFCVMGVLLGCATESFPPVVGPSVQTMSELLIKLKKGFDEGLLTKNSFYSADLGYPLRYQIAGGGVALQDAIEGQTFWLDKGDLSGVRMDLTAPPSFEKPLKVALIVEKIEPRCITRAQLRQIWGNPLPTIPWLPPLHGPVERPWEEDRYAAEHKGVKKEAIFVMRSQLPYCVYRIILTEIHQKKDSK